MKHWSRSEVLFALALAILVITGLAFLSLHPVQAGREAQPSSSQQRTSSVPTVPSASTSSRQQEEPIPRQSITLYVKNVYGFDPAVTTAQRVAGLKSLAKSNLRKKLERDIAARAEAAKLNNMPPTTATVAAVSYSDVYGDNSLVTMVFTVSYTSGGKNTGSERRELTWQKVGSRWVVIADEPA